MGKLHELLAVDQEIAAQSKKIIEEAKVTFTKKTPHFLGILKTLKMFDDARSNEEAAGRETQEIVTTVDEKLSFVTPFIIKHYDVLAQKEVANQQAYADVVLPDGSTLLVHMPATLLLALESRLAQLRDLYNDIPTLQAGVNWEIDSQNSRGGVFKSADKIVKNKTENTVMHKVLVQPTDKHPAQIEKWNKDIPVGVYELVQWSGMLTPKRKAEFLGKIDILIQAIKQARQRANCVEVPSVSIGRTIFDFINKE